MMSGELSSTRPSAKGSSMSQPPGDVCVEARLWQDPIETAERHIASTGHKPVQPCACCTRPQSSQGELPQQLQVYKNHDGGDHTGTVLKSWIERKLPTQTSDKGVLMLGVNMRGGAWPENREFRLRTRYAVVTALTSLGYNADDADRIGVMDVPHWPCGTQSNHMVSPSESTTGDGHQACRAIVPYERFTLLDEYKESTHHEFAAIAVVWLSDDYFGDPLYTKLAHLLCTLDHLPPPLHSEEDGVACKPGRLLSALGGQLELKLIGPTGSNGLIDMYAEEKRLLSYAKLNLPGFDCPALQVAMRLPPVLSKMLEHLEVWVPWATMSNPLVEWYANQRTEDRCSHSSYDAADRRCTFGPRYHRVTGTDDVLANALVQELELRSVLSQYDPPDNPEDSAETTPPEASSGKVVILTEADTSYGRTFPMQLAAAMKNRAAVEVQRGPDATIQPSLCPAQLKEMVTGGDWPPELDVYRYLRGADGIVPADDSTATNSDSGDNATKQQDVGANGPYSTRKKRRKPIGRAQYDYIRRLAAQLKRNHENLQAIGVCGTDVYDKLVLLRALRDEFPQLLMFTTDLYSRLEHGDNLPATHNLIIASHHTLAPNLQYLKDADDGDYWEAWTSLQDPTPMRDTYQAATFEACVSAVTQIAPTPDHMQRAYLYEIGRHGAYLLNDTSGRQIFVRSTWTWKSTAAIFAAVVAALLLVPFLPTGWIFISKVWHVVAVVCCLLPVLGLLVFAAWSHFNARGEPFVLWDGLSVWPSNLIRTFAGMTAVGLIILGQRSLDRNLKALANRFGSSPGCVLLPIADTSKDPRDGPFWHRDTVDIYLRTREKLSKMLSERFRIWGRRVASAFKGTNLNIRYTSARREKRSISQFLDLYRHEERRPTRFVRVGLLTVAYVGLIISLTLLFFPNGMGFQSLVRGQWTFIVSMGTLMLGVLLMLYLLFFTVDATRRCQQFIKTLANPEPPGPTDTDVDRGTPSPLQAQSEWDMIEIIGSRTREVNQLILFTMVVIVLLVVSRSSYFDNWGMPVPLLVIIGLNFAYAVLCAWSLRHAASGARRAAIERLKATAARLAEAAPVKQPDHGANERRKQQQKLIRDTIDRIQEYEEGSFGPWTKQPFLQSILYPSGGFGAAALIQYLVGS